MRKRKRTAANALVGGILIGIVVIAAIVGVVWTPYDPLKINFLARLHAPGGAFLLGTDEFGRDELSRLMAGASASVWISLLTVSFALLAGTCVGLLTGFVRGWTDRIVMAFNNALLAFPGLLLALGLLAVVGANKYGIILALGLAYTPRSRASCAVPCCRCAKRNSSKPRACSAIPSSTPWRAMCCPTAWRR
jgi:peptide/nickel transport system permease protein